MTKGQTKEKKELWQRYRVVLQVEGQFGAGLPKNPEEIKKMLETRMPGRKPEDAVPIEELAEQVAGEVGEADEEEAKPGWITFKSDPGGLYAEGRTVRGHLKDCAGVLAQGIFAEIKNFRSKFVNRVYVETRNIRLGKKAIDGTEERYIQVITKKGPRSAPKWIDYVLDPRLEFDLLVLDDGLITEEILRTILAYGAVHGMGAERSQGWGRYTVETLEKVKAKS